MIRIGAWGLCWIILECFLAEGVGFEPTELSFNGFQDRRLRPLGHPSGNHISTNDNNLNIINRLPKNRF